MRLTAVISESRKARAPPYLEEAGEAIEDRAGGPLSRPLSLQRRQTNPHVQP